MDWVVLTNAVNWRIYKVVFGKPIEQDLVCDFDFVTLDPKDDNHLQFLFLLTKEGWAKSAVVEFNEQKQALSRQFVAATLLADPVLTVIRRELKRLSPDVRIDTDQIRNVLIQEVIKREVIEGEKYSVAEKAIARATSKALRARKSEGASATEAAVDNGQQLSGSSTPPLPS